MPKRKPQPGENMLETLKQRCSMSECDGPADFIRPENLRKRLLSVAFCSPHVPEWRVVEYEAVTKVAKYRLDQLRKAEGERLGIPEETPEEAAAAEAEEAARIASQGKR